MLCVDVLIIGGSISGSSLGYQLEKNGIKTCVIDKAKFPRKKLCGGLLTQKTYDIIKDIYGDADFPYEVKTRSLSLFLGFDKLSSVTTDSNSNFFLVDRMDFDYFFVRQYISAGGTFLDDSEISEVDFDKNVAILSSQEMIGYKILIGADGANSHIRKYVDEKYRPNAMCLEFDSPSDNAKDELEVYFSVIQSGYGWCFPKKNRYTVGIGGVIKDNKDIKESFDAFCKSINKSAGQEGTKGALIPFGKYVKVPSFNNIILIGDAAGFVDPITGEGMYFAFLSAEFAKQTILEHMKCEKSLSAIYCAKICYIQKLIDGANLFNKLFFNKFTRPFFLKMIKGRTHIVKFFCENVLSQYNMSYMGFVTQYLKARSKRKREEHKKMVEGGDNEKK